MIADRAPAIIGGSSTRQNWNVAVSQVGRRQGKGIVSAG